MSREIRYYLGRVVKGGILNQDRLKDAILDPIELHKNKYVYSFVNMQDYGNFIFGKIAKFKRFGEIEKIDRKEHVETTIYEHDVKEVSSCFVYVPEFSGIAYQHIWNNFEKDQFESIFSKLVSEKFDNMLIHCEIDPVVDLRAFISRLHELKKINSIKATVKPPNPLFGPCWKSIKDYLAERNASEITINEEAKSGGLNTKIQKMIEIVLKHNKNALEEIAELTEYDNSLSDSAVLMAADGYGVAKIEGEDDSGNVIIRTKQNQKTFLAAREPSPKDLYEKVYSELTKINKERYLGH